jgi:putative mycofactocin binding protein MftB
MAMTAEAGPAGFDPALPWQRARSVAVRPEPFGALVYSFATRKLSFLKSTQLATVVQTLADHPSALAAIDASGVSEAQRPSYVRALAELAGSRMIEPREATA